MANLELTQEDYEAEFVRQRRVCEKDPDCVQKSREPWGKHLRCRCLDLEAGIMQMKVGLRWKTLDRSVKAGVETMSRGSKTTKRVMTGIVVTHQMPLAEFVYDAGNAEAVWRIWLGYDGKRECGTYLVLYSDGSIRRDTTMPMGGVDNSVQIAPKVGG